jgi:hypothetical protein
MNGGFNVGRHWGGSRHIAEGKDGRRSAQFQWGACHSIDLLPISVADHWIPVKFRRVRGQTGEWLITISQKISFIKKWISFLSCRSLQSFCHAYSLNNLALRSGDEICRIIFQISVMQGVASTFSIGAPLRHSAVSTVPWYTLFPADYILYPQTSFIKLIPRNIAIFNWMYVLTLRPAFANHSPDGTCQSSRDILARERIICHEDTSEAVRAPLPNVPSRFNK